MGRINLLNRKSAKYFTWPTVLCIITFATAKAIADPLDTPYYRTSYINTIGVRDETSDYKKSMLSKTGGIMPRNVKIGFATLSPHIGRAHGRYYDYLPPVYTYRDALKSGRQSDMTIGTHLNAMPWNDAPRQSLDILHNYLEKYKGGILLQKDRKGLIRNSSHKQDPTINEDRKAFKFMEMQLTLSPYAPLVQDYMMRNTRLAARYFAWLREDAPDIVTFCTLTSETGQNIANGEYCDYSDWTKQEFRDWLSGNGLYKGKGQYKSLAEFNADFPRADGFPWASWNAVVPPANVQFNFTPNGKWWYKWHEFRIAQVQHFEQRQMTAARSAGWSPDRLFGHQQPGTPGNLEDKLYTMKATPWTTTFVKDGGNGVTCGGSRASNLKLFESLAANDRNWAVVEYNPNEPKDFYKNVDALATVWSVKPHVICPYNWARDRPIKGTKYQTALALFIGKHKKDVYSAMKPYEAAAESRSLLWSMSYPSDIESSSGFSSLKTSNGVCTATLNQDTASISLELDESRHCIVSDEYYAISTRIFFSKKPTGDIAFQWTDSKDITSSVSIPVKQGWNLCHVNLSHATDWKEKKIKTLKLMVNGGTGNQIKLDWLQLEAGPCWHFDDPGEVSLIKNFRNGFVRNGKFTGTCGKKSYIRLALDDDRTFIDADRYKQVRIRLKSSDSGTGRLYWWTDAGGPYHKDFEVNDGTHTYELDLTPESNWTGRVTGLVLNPVNTKGTTCSIDYVAFSPLLLSPRSPVYNTIVNSPTPRLIWVPAIEPNRTISSYDLQIAKDFEFSKPLIKTNLNYPVYTHKGQKLDGFYWWRVRSRSEDGSVSPWMVPMPLFVRVWNANSKDFIKLHGFKNITVSNGIWTAKTGTDPHFELNTGWLDSKDTIDADTYKKLQIRMRIKANKTKNQAFVYFYPENGKMQVVRFSVPADDKWHTCTIHLSKKKAWKGRINRVRIDPTAYPNATVSIDWARFLPNETENP